MNEWMNDKPISYLELNNNKKKFLPSLLLMIALNFACLSVSSIFFFHTSLLNNDNVFISVLRDNNNNNLQLTISYVIKKHCFNSRWYLSLLLSWNYYSCKKMNFFFWTNKLWKNNRVKMNGEQTNIQSFLT